MATVSTKKGAKQKPPPPTVMTLTLNAAGTGTLITKRGDLAYVSTFVYHDMKGIITAIQQGAARLVEVEKNPPPKELFTSPASSVPPTVDPPDQPPVEGASAEASDDDEEVAEATPEIAEQESADDAANLTLLTEPEQAASTMNDFLDGVARLADTTQMRLM